MIGTYKDLTYQDACVSRKNIKVFDTDYPLAAMKAEELEIFNIQFPTLLGVPGSEERRIQLERVDVFMMGLRAIKYKLGDVAFRGVNPADAELGFGTIRPQYCANALAGYLVNWNIALAAATWTDYFFTGADTGYQLGREFGLVVAYLISYITPTPFVSEVHNKIGRTELIPTDVRAIKLGDNDNGVAVAQLPSMFLMPRDTWWMEIMADNAGTDIVAPGGIAVGLGSTLKETAATWAP